MKKKKIYLWFIPLSKSYTAEINLKSVTTGQKVLFSFKFVLLLNS